MGPEGEIQEVRKARASTTAFKDYWYHRTAVTYKLLKGNFYFQLLPGAWPSFTDKDSG
jgi:hypothetical protein